MLFHVGDLALCWRYSGVNLGVILALFWRFHALIIPEIDPHDSLPRGVCFGRIEAAEPAVREVSETIAEPKNGNAPEGI